MSERNLFTLIGTGYRWRLLRTLAPHVKRGDAVERMSGYMAKLEWFTTAASAKPVGAPRYIQVRRQR